MFDVFCSCYMNTMNIFEHSKTIKNRIKFCASTPGKGCHTFIPTLTIVCNECRNQKVKQKLRYSVHSPQKIGEKYLYTKVTTHNFIQLTDAWSCAKKKTLMNYHDHHALLCHFGKSWYGLLQS